MASAVPPLCRKGVSLHVHEVEPRPVARIHPENLGEVVRAVRQLARSAEQDSQAHDCGDAAAAHDAALRARSAAPRAACARQRHLISCADCNTRRCIIFSQGVDNAGAVAVFARVSSGVLARGDRRGGHDSAHLLSHT